MKTRISYIKTIPPDDAEGRLKKIYDRVKGPDGKVDNILMAHSLRPHSLEGHMALYKNVLHHKSNKTPKWFLETIGVAVSRANQCDYCVDHHFEGLKRLLNDDGRAAQIKSAIECITTGDRRETTALSAKEVAALTYALSLTTDPARIDSAAIDEMRQYGWADEEILEINQVAAYFSYANRTVLGLGVTSEGDTLGLSPNNSDNEDDWGHQ